MQVEEDVLGSIERRVIIGAIVDKTVLATISGRFEKNLCQSKFGNLILGWCVAHYRQHKKAPGRHIEDRFTEWAESGDKDKETVKATGKFLASLSGQWKQIKKDLHSKYVIDLAGKLFNRIRVERLSEDIKRLVDNGELDKAINKAEKFNKVEMGDADGIQVFKDKEALNELLEMEKTPPLIRYEGALGHFYGRTLSRGKFIAFEGPEKRGKSFFINDIGWVGMEQEKKVMFLQVGDMTKNEVMERFYSRACGRPLLPTEEHFPMRWPKHIEPGGETVTHKEYTYKKPLSRKEIRKLTKKVTDKWNDMHLMELYVWPNYSVNIMQIKDVIARRADAGWVPDIVVLDYMELLVPMVGMIDTREQIDANWKHGRGISQEYDMLFVTAAQTDTDSYSAHTITMKNFSGSKTKNAHVSGMVGINQTDIEKENGIYRLNWVNLRGRKYSTDKFVYTASCLDVANPCVISTY